ncbi:chloride channel protein [Streptomyces sp. NRRL F-5126]|uniref:chloride channel protein n=1 Tax=Streptomyces sp. NRRL F-5126 TaxID=1463857 RepID=UPI001F406EDE|nr:chloride channel protein [Streptomyces sp. NRRL F-5126]
MKSLASALCLRGGGSVGHEGPVVQIGSTPGRLLGVAEDRGRVLVACGAAGGIAATFNAPLSGVFSSVVSSVIGRAALGSGPFPHLPPIEVHHLLECILFRGPRPPGRHRGRRLHPDPLLDGAPRGRRRTARSAPFRAAAGVRGGRSEECVRPPGAAGERGARRRLWPHRHESRVRRGRVATVISRALTNDTVETLKLRRRGMDIDEPRAPARSPHRVPVHAEDSTYVGTVTARSAAEGPPRRGTAGLRRLAHP